VPMSGMPDMTPALKWLRMFQNLYHYYVSLFSKLSPSFSLAFPLHRASSLSGYTCKANTVFAFAAIHRKKNLLNKNKTFL